MTTGQFYKDKMAGEAVEKEFSAAFLKKHPDAIITTHPNKLFSDWDIHVTIGGKTKTYEIKYDRMARITGNHGLEVFCNNKFTGPYVSKADYFIIKFKGKFYWQDRKKLIELLSSPTADEYVWKYSWGGDGNKALLCLIKEANLLKFYNEWKI